MVNQLLDANAKRPDPLPHIRCTCGIGQHVAEPDTDVLKLDDEGGIQGGRIGWLPCLPDDELPGQLRDPHAMDFRLLRQPRMIRFAQAELERVRKAG